MIRRVVCPLPVPATRGRAVARRAVARRAHRAFTLIGILMATVVFSVLIAALYGVFYGAIRLRETTFERVESGLPRDQILAVIRRDLTAVVPPVGILAAAMTGETGTLGSARSDHITFSAASGSVTDAEPWGDVVAVSYFLDESSGGDDENGYDLVREVSRNLLASVEEEPESERILEGVDSFEIAYFDGTSWLDSWDSTTRENETPDAIRMRIGLATGGLKAGEETSGRQTLDLICEIVSKPRTTSASAAATPSGGGSGT
ncbi:type II secretion system protein GspJ [Candidatus Sumerlaeota bacterium]|nr:type II secretion system protein GspJ [Candidatus Sumerlaeota bacterium]